MIYQATREISDYFTMREIRHQVTESEQLSSVEAGFSAKHVQNVLVRFISAGEGSDVAVRVLSFGGMLVDADHREAVIRCLGDLNEKYRYVKFCLTDKGSVNVEYDLTGTVPFERLGVMCREIFIRFINILDETYIPLIRAAVG